jgi:hypothetical protein
VDQEAVRAATTMIEAATRITRGRGAAATSGGADERGRRADERRGLRRPLCAGSAVPPRAATATVVTSAVTFLQSERSS